MATHVSEKKIKDEILMKNPVPSNLVEPQKLDAYYIEELLSENKRNMNLQNKKTLKGMQEKVVDILPPISRLYHIMKRGGVLEVMIQDSKNFFRSNDSVDRPDV